MKKLLRCTIAAWMAVSSAACGGGDDGGTCAAPLTISSGTWCVTLTSTVNTCSEPLDPPYETTFTQDGSALSALTQYGWTYSGTVCGSVASMAGENLGVSTTVQLSFSDAGTASGEAHWNTGTCSGTDTFTAAAGTCL